MYVAVIITFLLFALFGGVWASGLIAADTSNKVVLAISGVTGVAGSLFSGYSDVTSAVSLVLQGHSTGWGMTVFVVGIFVVGGVWLMNIVFTADHEPIL